MKNNSHKTAMTRKKISRPLKTLIRWSSENNIDIKDRLDYGCGKGGDLIDGTVGYDPFYFPKKPNRVFSCVSCVYVLNVIEDINERMEVIKEVINLSNDVVMFAVRMDDIKGVPYKDGVKTKIGTFQKQFNKDELINLLPDNLIIVYNRSGTIIARKNMAQ